MAVLEIKPVNLIWQVETTNFIITDFFFFFSLSFQVGQEIEVRPGIVSKEEDGQLSCKPILSRILSLFAEQNDLQYAVPGGLIGMYFILCQLPFKTFLLKSIHLENKVFAFFFVCTLKKKPKTNLGC